jgi:SAM-dependent methyltransferase
MEKLAECPTCRSNQIGLRFKGKTARNPADAQEWQVYECKMCGLGFLNPRPDWNELSFYYSEQYAAYKPSHGAQASDDAVIAEARSTGRFRHIPIPEGKRLLDVGCGGGYFLRICQMLGATVQGVEPSPIAAAQARAQGFQVFTGMLDDFDTHERFDIITANQVLEHVPDPVATLAKMKSLLAPGGMIWLAVPNGDCVWAKKLGWEWDGADLPFHLLQFGPESIKVAAEGAGLEVTKLYTESVPKLVAYTRRKYLRSRYGIPQKLSGLFINARNSATIGSRLDAATAGDNLIVELR